MVQRRQRLRLHQPPIWRRRFRAFFGYSGRRLSQLARRPDGRVRRHQRTQRLPGGKRPACLTEVTKELPSTRTCGRAVLFLKYEKIVLRTQDRRRLLSEARALPPLTFGTIINSRTVTLTSST